MSTPDKPLKIEAEVTLEQKQPQDEKPKKKGPTVPEIVSSKVADAYYPEAVAAADNARARSQAGYAIAAAIATAIVTAGLVGGIEDTPTVVQVAGMGALAAWLYAAYQFMYAVSERKPDPQAAESKDVLERHPSALAFVEDVLTDSANERKAVEQHQKAAMESVMVALILTFATIAGVLIDQPDPPDTKRGTFTLFEGGQGTVGRACDRGATPLAGTVDPAKLSEEFVPIAVDAGACRAEKVTLRLRKKDIAAVALAD